MAETIEIILKIILSIESHVVCDCQRQYINRKETLQT